MPTEITIAGIITGIGAIAVGFWKAVSIGKEIDKKVDKDLCKIVHFQTQSEFTDIKKAVLKSNEKHDRTNEMLNEIKITLAKMNGG